MSGFIDNPFADPFADPAISQVTSAPTATITAAAQPVNTTNTTNTGTNNANNNNSIKLKQAASSTTIAGSATSVTTTPPPVTTSAAATTINMDTKQMQNELERRQQELEIKAAELTAREEALRASGGFRQHNWPPVPSFCPFKPCFFQDINVDIPPEFQKTVQLGYHLWIAFVFTLLINLLGAIACMIQKIDGIGEVFSFALMSFIFFVPLTYMTWFRPLYKAFKNDSSFNFMVFFLVFTVQTVITSYWSLGVQGSCGLFLALKTVGTGFILSTFLFMITGCWITYAVASTLYLLKVHSIYRSTGASIAKARNEFAEGIIRNQYVQQTVASAARQTMTQTFANATGNNSTANQSTAGVRQ